MGCISSKGIKEDNHIKSQRVKKSKSLRRLVISAKDDEVLVADGEEVSGNEGGRERLISNPEEIAVSPTPVSLDNGEKKVVDVVERNRSAVGHQRRVALDLGANGVNQAESSLNNAGKENGKEPSLGIPNVPNGFVGEHVAAGWPSWLTAVAGEAVKGWLPRKADSFERLNKIGQGTYSNVYRARDLETGKVVALKKVRFVNMDPESVRFMAREIYILRRLDHPNVVKLEGLVTSRMSCSLYLVFEYMEHDLAGLAATPGIKFTEPQVKCYMQQLLSGLYHCHNRGVLHRDIKGSNLLIDNNGILKIADFGLATFFNPDQKQPLTSRVVTLWYRPPELLLGATDYSVAVDLWSTGCILAELLAGKPIMPGRTEVEQLHKIFKLCGSPSEEFWRKSRLPHATIFKPQHPYRRCVNETFRDFPSSAVALLEKLLAIEPAERGTAASALNSEFFTTKPFACKPSTLPKYPPSKEFDAKLRDEEARRQRAVAIKGKGFESGKGVSREYRVMPAPDGYADLQKRLAHANPKSISEKYNSQEDGGTGFPIEPPVGDTENGFMHAGNSGSMWNAKAREGEHRAFPGSSSAGIGRSNGPESGTQRPSMSRSHGPGFSNLSGPIASRSISIKMDGHRERVKHPHWPEHRSGARYDQLEGSDASATHHLLDRPSSSLKKDGRTETKDPTMGGHGSKNRIHYSGPLMPPGGNLDEMLKEHERQIQQAVRKARLDKDKNKSSGVRVQSEALLSHGRNGRSDA